MPESDHESDDSTAFRPTVHVPVMCNEVIEWLDPQPGQILLDGTLGGGGHARRLAERVAPTGRVIATDRDEAAVNRARRELAGTCVTPHHADYADLPRIVEAAGVSQFDGALLDLGLSSDQLADATRGFSYESDGPLDLRFDDKAGEPAWRWLERLSEKEIADAIYRFGEERFSRRIARRIVESRRTHPIRTARDLAELVRRCVPRSRGHQIDPATRTFQALRILVNDEWRSLESALASLPQFVRPGGRVAIISFHSLEDRPVKQAFRDDPRWEPLVRKPIRPADREIAENPRSRSAKLRVAKVQAASPTDAIPTRYPSR